MKLISLQSGSNGNCIYIETDCVNILLDAGISGKQAQTRLAETGRDIHDVDAVLISHDHGDHIRSAGVFQRKFSLPIHITNDTLAGAGPDSLGKLSDVRHFQAGQTIKFDSVSIETIPTPHDGCDGVVFVIDDGNKRLGVLTDLGHVFDGLPELIGSLDAVLIESNYDEKMLSAGPYPAFLKRRISGPRGHISNIESAQLLAEAATDRLQWACLGHMSAQNNRPELAMEIHQEVLGDRIGLYAASRYGVSQVLDV